MEISTWGVLAGISLALVTVLPTIYRGLKTFYNKVFGGRGHQLDRIEAELLFNGGSSLKDLVYTMSTQVDKINNQVIEQRALQLAYFSTKQDAVWTADANGDLTWASPALQKLVGRTQQELYGTGWVNMFPQRLRDAIHHEWYDHTVEEERNFEHCTKVAIGDEELHVLVTGIKMMNDNEVIGYFGTVKIYDEID
jgi:PAS domain S-box-containing protein